MHDALRQIERIARLELALCALELAFITLCKVFSSVLRAARAELAAGAWHAGLPDLAAPQLCHKDIVLVCVRRQHGIAGGGEVKVHCYLGAKGPAQTSDQQTEPLGGPLGILTFNRWFHVKTMLFEECIERKNH
eukprot:scaffold22447_cov70-Phaeocystis_antarctica.AAC.5